VKCCKDHFLCNHCFSNNVINQLSYKKSASFALDDCNIVYNFCLPTRNAFTKQQLVCHLSDTLFNDYMDATFQVIEAKKAEAASVAGANLCVLCLTNPRTHCFVPCGHVCLCSACCASQHNFDGKCLVCRAKFTTIFRPFV